MKIENKKDINNYDFKKYKARIDSQHEGKAILALIDLYKRKITTPVQEIICNARDAHREVGKPEHSFKISLTNGLFTVRDYGKGMSPDRVDKVYRSIGATTKGSSNAQTGSFGIGGKSPLCNVNQFNIKTFVNGVMYFYVIKRESEGIGVYLINKENTKEENGTLIEIPVKNGEYSRYEKAIIRCVYAWGNLPEIEGISDIEKRRVGGILINKYDIYCKYVSLDGILYSLDRNYFNIVNNKVIPEFKTGELKPNQTREFLELTENQKNNIDLKMEKLEKNLKDFIRNVMKKANTFNDILTTNNEFEKLIPRRLSGTNFFNLNDKNIRLYKGVKRYSNAYYTIISHEENCRYHYDDGKISLVNNNGFDTVQVIINNDTNLTRRKCLNSIKVYCDNNNISKLYYVSNYKNLDKVLKGYNIVKMSDIKTDKKVKNSKKIDNSYIRYYSLLYNYDRKKLIKDFKETTYYLPYNATSFERNNATYLQNCIRLTKSEMKKIKDNKNFISYEKHVKNFKVNDKHINHFIKNRICELFDRNILSFSNTTNKEVLAYCRKAKELRELKSEKYMPVFKEDVEKKALPVYESLKKDIDAMRKKLYSKYEVAFNPTREVLTNYLNNRLEE